MPTIRKRRKTSHKKTSHKKRGHRQTSTDKKVRTIGSKASVWKGHAKRTKGGATKADIERIAKKDNTGYEYKFKSKMMQGKKNSWILAVKKARKELDIKGFVPVKKGSELYTLAKSYHNP